MAQPQCLWTRLPEATISVRNTGVVWSLAFFFSWLLTTFVVQLPTSRSTPAPLGPVHHRCLRRALGSPIPSAPNGTWSEPQSCALRHNKPSVPPEETRAQDLHRLLPRRINPAGVSSPNRGGWAGREPLVPQRSSVLVDHTQPKTLLTRTQ